MTTALHGLHGRSEHVIECLRSSEFGDGRVGESARLRATSRDDLVPFLFERINPLVDGGESRGGIARIAEA